MNDDIVYILKNDVAPDELRYSLRSIERNFPHRNVIFYGGCPKGIDPDRYVEYKQSNNNKWLNVRDTLLRIFDDDGITEDFWLFNDDFFVMKLIDTENYIPPIRGSLLKRVQDIENHHGRRSSGYSVQLYQTYKKLFAMGCDTLDYALHVPFLVNRKLGKEAIDTFPDCPMFRSVYGNYARIGGLVRKDVKISSKNTEPDPDLDYISTNDVSFKEGLVGEYIRSQFPEKCKYEQDH